MITTVRVINLCAYDFMLTMPTLPKEWKMNKLSGLKQVSIRCLVQGQNWKDRATAYVRDYFGKPDLEVTFAL